MRRLVTGLPSSGAFLGVVALVVLATAAAAVAAPRTLDGSFNNLQHPDWGRANTPYLRVGPPNYADGIAEMVAAPPHRYVSNRIFNDIGQNLFSENGVSQWGFAWGQFVDHDFGLRDQGRGERDPIAFDKQDPLEAFTNDFGAIEFSRTPAAPGTGLVTPREQLNIISSYIDASGVYGVTNERLEWLREGPVDGNLANNGAKLLLPGGYLPRRDARGDASTAPEMELVGGLRATPAKAMVAGDVRANENIGLTSIHTLFAREHNRIVEELPSSLSEEEKFQIARRVVGAEIQFINYNEFLPALGVDLPTYQGYKPQVNVTLGNEFAVVGYRAHSMVHGEFEPKVAAGTYTPAQLEEFEEQGIEVEEEGDEVELAIPLTVAFANPDLLQDLGEGPMVGALGREPQYKNDEQIDDVLRSVLFQAPKPRFRDQSRCALPKVDPACFSGVLDLGAIDLKRARDHGIPLYNDLREAFGLAPKTSFTAITGEATDGFPSDRAIGPDPINDPDILDFVELRDGDGNVIPPDSEEAEGEAVVGIRRTTLAARLKAIYGGVDQLEPFVGMLSEDHVPGTDFGQLQLAIWKKQFQALRDGDRFFHLNDPEMSEIQQRYGIGYRHTLAEVIERNTDAEVRPNVFNAP